MTVGELRDECQREGLLLRQCSEHHFQLTDDHGTPLVDVWPTTGKFRWCGASESAKATSGSARRAVQKAIFTVRQNAAHGNAIETLPPRIKANGCPPADSVNHPPHYKQGPLEVIDAIEGLGLGFHAGNVVKYVARYKAKGGAEDLRKAKWYLERLIELESRG